MTTTVKHIEDARRLGGPGARVVDEDGAEINLGSEEDGKAKTEAPPSIDLTAVAASLEKLAKSVTGAVAMGQASQSAALKSVVDSLQKILTSVQEGQKAKAPIKAQSQGWVVTPTRGANGYIISMTVKPLKD